MTYTDLRMMFSKLSQSDCGDNSCAFAGKMKGGMRTNGGCRCADKYIYEIIDAIKADRRTQIAKVIEPLERLMYSEHKYEELENKRAVILESLSIANKIMEDAK